MVCNLQQAYSKRQYSAVSPTLPWKTSSQQHKMHLEWYHHISREGISANRLPGIFGGCWIPLQLQLDKSQWAPCHRWLSAGSFGTSKPRLATWAQPVSQGAVDTAGLCPSHCSARDPHPLLGAVPHALTPCFSPLPASRLYYCSHSSAPHLLVFGRDSSSPVLCHPVTLRVFLIFAKYQPWHDQTKGLSEAPRALHFRGNLRWNSHITVQVDRREQKVTVSLLLEHTQFIYWCKGQVHLIPCPPSASSLFLKFISLAVNLWNWVAHYLLSSLFLFLSH